MKNTIYGSGLEKQVDRFELCHEEQIFGFGVALAWMLMIKDETYIWDLIIPMVWMVMPFTQNGKTVVKIYVYKSLSGHRNQMDD